MVTSQPASNLQLPSMQGPWVCLAKACSALSLQPGMALKAAVSRQIDTYTINCILLSHWVLYCTTLLYINRILLRHYVLSMSALWSCRPVHCLDLLQEVHPSACMEYAEWRGQTNDDSHLHRHLDGLCGHAISNPSQQKAQPGDSSSKVKGTIVSLKKQGNRRNMRSKHLASLCKSPYVPSLQHTWFNEAVAHNCIALS